MFTFVPPPEVFQEFYDEVWKQGHAFTRIHEGVPILEKFLSRLAYRDVILVRDEYSRIWDHVLLRHRAVIDSGQEEQEGLTINGQAGIGKSIFLYYALGAALLERIPVVLCRHERFCHIFDATGFTRFWFDQGETFDVPDHTLFLVDCHYHLSSPPSLFLERSGVLVVTGVTGWHDTGWERMNPSGRTLFWMMDAWTRAEMHALQRTLEALTTPTWLNPRHGGTTVYTPIELLDLLGPSPRQCLHFAGKRKTPTGPNEDLRPTAQPGCLWVLDNLDAVLGPAPDPSTGAGAGTPTQRGVDRPLPISFVLDDNLDGVVVLSQPKSPLSPTRDGRADETKHPDANADKNPSRAPPEFHYAVPTLLLRQLLTDFLFRPILLTRWRPSRAIAAVVRARSPSFAAAAFYQPLLVQALRSTRAGHVCHIVSDDDDDNSDDRETVGLSKFDAPPTFCLGPGLALRHQSIELELGSGGELDSEACLASALTDPPRDIDDCDKEKDDNTHNDDSSGDEEEDEADARYVGPESGRILVPRAGFTAFDLIVVSERMTRVTLLRAAVGPDARLPLSLDNTESASERDAIRRAIALFDRVLPDPQAVRWCFVYAARDGARARGLAERARLEEVDSRLRAGWMQMGGWNERAREVLDVLECAGIDIESGEDGEEYSEEQRFAKRRRRG